MRSKGDCYTRWRTNLRLSASNRLASSGKFSINCGTCSLSRYRGSLADVQGYQAHLNRPHRNSNCRGTSSNRVSSPGRESFAAGVCRLGTRNGLCLLEQHHPPPSGWRLRAVGLGGAERRMKLSGSSRRNPTTTASAASAAPRRPPQGLCAR